MTNPPRSRDDLIDALTALMPQWRVSKSDAPDASAARDFFGAFEYLSGGYANENYLVEAGGERVVLRLPRRTGPFIDRALEGAFHRNQMGPPTPEVLAFDERSGRMVSRYQPGTLLSDADQSLERLAGYLRQVHRALPDSGRSYDPVALSRTYLEVGAPPAWAARMAKQLRWRPSVSAPCHNDLTPWNVIIPPEGPWVTLDWEWLGSNDPLFDLVTLHQGLLLSDDSLPVLAEQWQGSAVEEARLERCLEAFWLREFGWAHFERYHGNALPEIAAQQATAAERLRAFR